MAFGYDNKCLQSCSGTTGVGGSYGFIQVVLMIKNEQGNYQSQFIKQSIDSCFAIKSETFLTSKQFDAKLKEKQLPPKFITMTYNNKIWETVKQKNCKLIEAWPNFLTRQKKASMFQNCYFVFVILFLNFDFQLIKNNRRYICISVY